MLGEAERTRLVEALAAGLYGRDLVTTGRKIQRRITEVPTGALRALGQSMTQH